MLDNNSEALKHSEGKVICYKNYGTVFRYGSLCEVDYVLIACTRFYHHIGLYGNGICQAEIHARLM